MGGNTPLLDLPERLQLGNRNENNDSLLSTSNINFPGSRDLERAKLGLKLWDVVLEVNQSLCNVGFSLVGGLIGSVGGAENFVVHGHFWERLQVTSQNYIHKP
jgi:hypothetical protein